MREFWKWAVIVVVVFVCINVYQAQLLKNVPLVGGYLSS
jgi:hypothetical protein